jgi:O-methyltransferase involved in polyketide biosynthesis
LQPAQVIILAAGLAPLSVELAALFPKVKIFDVDRELMVEKEKILHGQFANIQFITCDISNMEKLTAQLFEKGWHKDHPTLEVFEGIIYYLREEDLKNILCYFAKHTATLACDFALDPRGVDLPNRMFGTEVFRKIEEATGIAKVRFYMPDYFVKLLEDCGYQNIQLQSSAILQTERTGKPAPFEGRHSSWINFIQAS